MFASNYDITNYLTFVINQFHELQLLRNKNISHINELLFKRT